MLARISKGYQLTIPAAMRNKFRLKPGTEVDVHVKKNKIVITPLENISIEDVFKRADRFKAHNLTPEDLEKMEDELY